MDQDAARISLDGDWQLIHFPQGGRSIVHPDDLPRPFDLNQP